MKLYGIKNCNSVKKAIDILNVWLKQRSFQELINTAGKTAKSIQLNKEKIKILNDSELEKIILENPSCIKRPIIESKSKIYIGKEYEKNLH